FDDMERKIAENGVRLFILCSPHNPVGRIWSADELRRMGEICGKYGTVIVADEIHCDFRWPGREYRLMLEACPEFADRVVSCTAPSKTFNLAGMQTSNIWIPDAELRRRFADEVHSRGFFSPGILGAEACRAAYEGGEEWFDQCLEYLHGNYEYVRDYLAARIPEIKPVEPDGTYFLWLDFSALGMERAELDDFVLNKAGLWVDEGHIFGTGGEGFQRIILACPRSMLAQAMEQLEKAVKALR
ncbi:MAG: aminotransferase class I/II-fold pyridoxal phosphate-dependent enzyme, partial [Firmicutes bacterium]|nr:aminotransferase class I/II-fold pyridoxal phosphate-dependent enzyme [Bacillota bacterium]